MGKKVKHIRIRITESQARWLADVLVAEQRNKSQILRDALNKYLVENTHRNWNKEEK
jgi:metal-responsive CopG/Arc/MetJ family transcriptional regulator